MNRQKWFILIFVVLCVSIWGLDAKKIVINDNELERTLHCQGDEVVVNGNENELTIKGECSKLYVPGNENVINVEAVAVIDTPGNDNTVYWEKGIDGKDPAIRNLGTDNKIKKVVKEEEEEDDNQASDTIGVSKTVGDALSKLDVLNKGRKGTAKESSKIIRIDGNYRVKTLTLQGEKLVVNGNFHKIKVKGSCSHLQVNGNTNVVKVDAVGSISAVGNMNKVYWKKGLDDKDPTISNVGTNNEITQVDQ